MTQTFEPDDLCRRAEGVRALARRLTGDVHRAEDVVQEALATSIVRPAPARTPAGAWLRGIVRNIALRTRRDDARRVSRDRRAAPPRPPADPAEVVARAELHRMLVDAVLALDEPYRSTLLRRYFDGLSAAEIARELAIPAATVRTRIHRGLALLRGRLDTGHGGRKSWTVALLPLLAGPPAPPPPALPVPAVPLVAGAAAMSAKKITTVVVVLLILGGVMLALRPSSTVPAPPASGPPDESGLRVSGTSEPPRPPETTPTVGDGATAAPSDSSPEPRAEVSVNIWRGSRGVEGVPVVLSLNDSDGSVGIETVTDPDGVARFGDLRPGKYDVSARVLERTVWEGDIDVFPGVPGREWSLRLLLGGTTVLDGVVRGSGGEGVPGAIVTLETRPERSDGRLVTVVETGIDGGYVTSVPTGRARWFEVRADGFAPWPGLSRQTEVVRSLEPLARGERATRNAVLDRGGTLRGVVRTEDGRGIADVTILHRSGRARSAAVVTAGDGSFRVPHLIPGVYRLRVGTPPWYPAEGQSMNAGVSLEDTAEPFDITVTRGRRVEGIVLAPDGAVAPGASVCIVNDDGVPIHGRSGALVATADEEGRFAIDDIPPRDRVGLRAGLGALRALAMPFRLGPPPPTVTIRLEATCTVRGRVVDVATQSGVKGVRVLLVPIRPTLGVPKSTRTNDRGDFEVRGVPPGSWKLTYPLNGYLPAEPRDLLVPRSGEVDLTLGLDPGEVFAGTIVDEDGDPVYGARVAVATTPDGAAESTRRQTKTDRRGAFRLSGVVRGSHVIKASQGVRRMDPVALERGETGLRLVLLLPERK